MTKLETDWWIELESTYRARIAQRQGLYRAHGKDVMQWLPGSELACKELMEMVLQVSLLFFIACTPMRHFPITSIPADTGKW